VVTAPSARPNGLLLQDLLRRGSFVVCRSFGRYSGISWRSFGRSGISSWRHFGRSRSGFFGRGRRSFFLLATAGTQHEGNRNGAPNLCIHRQLPQVRSVRKGGLGPQRNHRVFKLR